MITQICAWCSAQGIRTIIQQGDEPGESHGCCEYHGSVLRAEAFENYLERHPGEEGRLTGETP